jgi:ribosome-binding protein aMBF1 (putative translation factor)
VGWSDSGAQWRLGGGSHGIAKFFTDVAESAAVELGHSGGPSALFFWLDLLKRDSPFYKSSGSGGVINRVSEASAEYCLKCETHAKVDARAKAAKQVATEPIAQEKSTLSQGPKRRGPKPRHSEVKLDEVPKRRREILKRFRVDRGIGTMQDLARHLGMSLTAIHGIVRDDTTRYSQETRLEFLKKIGVDPEKW